MARQYDEFDNWLLGGKKLIPFEPGISAGRRRILTREDNSGLGESHTGADYAKIYQLNEDKAALEVNLIS